MTQFGGSDNTTGSSGRASRTMRPSGGVHGGLVTETGIALVHEGEIIRPREDSEATVELTETSAITINLPVIVEVVGRRDDTDMELTVNETLRRLRYAIEATP